MIRQLDWKAERSGGTITALLGATAPPVKGKVVRDSPLLSGSLGWLADHWCVVACGPPNPRTQVRHGGS